MFTEPYYNFRSEGSSFVQRKAKITYYSLQFISYLATTVWNRIPYDIRNCRSLKDLKNGIKGWTSKQCSCRLL